MFPETQVPPLGNETSRLLLEPYEENPMAIARGSDFKIVKQHRVKRPRDSHEK